MTIEQKIEILKTALKFYADIDNYVFNSDGKGLVIPEEDKQSIILSDMGVAAIAALTKVSKE